MTQQVHATAIQAEPRWPHPAADVDQLPLRDDVTRLDTLLVPADLAQPTQWRLRERVVPFLEVLLRAALERQTIGSVLETQS